MLDRSLRFARAMELLVPSRWHIFHTYFRSMKRRTLPQRIRYLQAGKTLLTEPTIAKLYALRDRLHCTEALITSAFIYVLDERGEYVARKDLETYFLRQLDFLTFAELMESMQRIVHEEFQESQSPFACIL